MKRVAKLTYRQVAMYLRKGLDQLAGVDAGDAPAKMRRPVDDDPNDISRCTGEQARAKLQALGLLGGF